MMLSLVLDFSDPYVEFIQHFPSRNPPPPPALNFIEGCGEGEGGERELLVDKDAMVVQGNTAELQRLSAELRMDVHSASTKPPSFKTITQAVILTNRARSQACVLQ
jgi:hypothetical protein